MDHLDPTRHPEPPKFNPQSNAPSNSRFNSQFGSQSSSQFGSQSNSQFDSQSSPPSDPRFDSRSDAQSDAQPDTPAPPIQHRLISDLRQVIDNAEDLLHCTDSRRDGAYRAARDKLAQTLAAATEELQRIEDAQLERMIAATHEASIRHDDRTGEARLLRAFH